MKDISNHDAITAFIARRLAQEASPDDITAEVCERFNLVWSHAEPLVRAVEIKTPPKKAGWIHVFNRGTLGFGVIVLIAVIAFQVITWNHVSSSLSIFPPFRFSRMLYAQAGQQIVIDYDLKVESGSMFIRFDYDYWWEALNRDKTHYDPMHPDYLLDQPIRTTRLGHFIVPIPIDGWYNVRIGTSNYRGTYDISWHVESSN